MSKPDVILYVMIAALALGKTAAPRMNTMANWLIMNRIDFIESVSIKLKC